MNSFYCCAFLNHYKVKIIGWDYLNFLALPKCNNAHHLRISRNVQFYILINADLGLKNVDGTLPISSDIYFWIGYIFTNTMRINRY